jgi:hypothetical protein
MTKYLIQFMRITGRIVFSVWRYRKKDGGICVNRTDIYIPINETYFRLKDEYLNNLDVFNILQLMKFGADQF